MFVSITFKADNVVTDWIKQYFRTYDVQLEGVDVPRAVLMHLDPVLDGYGSREHLSKTYMAKLSIHQRVENAHAYMVLDNEALIIR
ncbi:hypothetical protein Tco_1505738 [Tanacetum coccineum]